MKSKWKIISITIFILTLIIAGYFIPLFGFGDYTSPTGEFKRGKTIWDWLQLLIIPLALAVGAYYLNKKERELEREVAKDHQQERALQAYLDRMSDLLLGQDLQDEKVRNVARIRTLTVLRGLDARRKGMLLLFLNESGLIAKQPEPTINLCGADLSGAELEEANLRETSLNGTILSKANLREADLTYADLSGANLTQANLMLVSLYEANLRDVCLENTNLHGAHLDNAELRGAYFDKTDLSGTYLYGAHFYSADIDEAALNKAHFNEEDLYNADPDEEYL
ncbi:MAG: pentapeptide repeat-containing protein [Anaerolineales bacterium]